MPQKHTQTERLHAIMLEAHVEHELRKMIQRRTPRNLRHQIEAEDSLQDLWVAVEEAAPRLHAAGRESDTLYLQCMLRSLLSDQVRAMRAKKRGGGHRRVPWDAVAVLPADDESPDIPAWRREAAACVWRAVEQLTQTQRQIIRLIYLEGLSIAEAARRTGKTKAAVLKTRARAMQSLRALLSQWLPRGGDEWRA